MSSWKRMLSIADTIQQKADNAARVLAESRLRTAEHEAKLDELVVYREEYTERLRSLGQGGLGAVQAQGLNQFLGRLSQAIEQQQGILRRARSEQERNLQLWLASERRARSIDKAVARHRQREEQIRDLHEQYENDACARFTACRK